MATNKITKRFVESITNNTGKDLFIRDTELKGFGLKVTANGSKSFIVEARIKGGKPKRIVIGKYPLLSAEQAREKAHRTLATYKEGIDPIEQEKERKEKELKNQILKQELGLKLSQAIEDFMSVRSNQLKPKTLYDYRSLFRTCFDDWIDKPIREITRKDISLKHKELAERGKPLANKALRVLGAVFNFAKGNYEIQGQRLIEDNPVNVLSETKARFKEKPRERYIKPEELECFIKAAIKLEGQSGETVRDYLLMLLFTGLRSNEALKLKWQDVDFIRKLFTVRDTKNGSDHTIPMSSFIYSMLCYRNERYGKESEYVFLGTGKAGHFIDPRKQIAKVTQESGIKFTPHDLRRTYATILNDLDFTEIAIKRLMNHKTKSITERYIQSKAENFRKHLEAVAEYIEVGVDWASPTISNEINTDFGFGCLQEILYWKNIKNKDVLKSLDICK